MPRKVDPVKEKLYAKARGKGASRKEAAKAAGYTSERAGLGRTGYELEKKDTIRALMDKEVEVTASKLKLLLGAQVMGAAPTKIVKGKDAKVEWDTLAARTQLARVHGMGKDTIRIELPEDQAEALEEIRSVLQIFGVQATTEEIAAKLEAAGGA